MKLVGYIKEFKECMFTIPIYSDGVHNYYHVIDDKFIIVDFEKLDGESDMIPFNKVNFMVEIGSPCVLVFIKKQGIIISYNVDGIKSYLENNTNVDEYLIVKGEVEYVEDAINKRDGE